MSAETESQLAAEVERLNGEVLDLTERLHWQVNENTSLRKLLTECADALEPVLLRTLKPHLKDLIQRVREATKI